MRLSLRIVFVLVCSLLGASIPLRAQAVGPTISLIVPSSVTAGGPGFPLTVMGSGFIANSIVRVNGTNRATGFVSSGQLTATIPASDIATAGSLAITVFNPAVGAPGQTSNTATLAVGNPPLPLPTLTSVAPGFAAPGTGQVRMTLIGANFRPGAVVVISPPVATVSGSPANTQAADISVDSIQRVSSSILIVLVSFSSEASPSLRAVDVVNSDQTNTGGVVGTALTGSGTTQPLRFSASSSLGAPLSVVTIAVTHPRDGTLVMQGDDLYGEAILAGTGTGR